jgi:hypothetical protein
MPSIDVDDWNRKKIGKKEKEKENQTLPMYVITECPQQIENAKKKS